MTAASGPTPRLLTAGQLFLDLVFADLADAPRLGEEHWTPAFGWGPGGIANYAIAAARLGVPTALTADVGDDAFSHLVRERLTDEGIAADLHERADWNLPVTTALGYGGDRALVTGGRPAAPLASVLATAPVTPVAAVHIDASVSDWVRERAARGTKVFADIGWDADESWDPDVLSVLDGCHAFLPNEAEARAYTRRDDARAAARALAERVPLSVVTRGGHGAIAVDSSTGEEIEVGAVRIDFVDATGAGDVFGGALAAAELTAWALRERVDFATLVAAVTVSRPGGAAASPRLDELVPWLDAHPGAADPARFAFLRDALHDGAFPFDAAPHARPLTPAPPTRIKE
ncbi:MAG: carbohydrate kinase family protein [Microbacterium sp.]|jgi:sugar/nucleoside kinase (ribokinase family)|uniref:carbohydrate kinase family protein n=1 Tax=Microbacterium sp. TaxID=51671 RepID=UPI0025D92635|nr:PfkB family carbohydrate kinase [Microbacterium sp.]MBQ9918471.1 carbohydrate kinase family protein [Microbacterium sp.]